LPLARIARSLRGTALERPASAAVAIHTAYTADTSVTHRPSRATIEPTAHAVTAAS